MMQMTEEFGGVPPNWIPYFLVENCATAVAKASGLGVKIEVESREIGGLGQFVLFRDTQGANFSVFQDAI